MTAAAAGDASRRRRDHRRWVTCSAGISGLLLAWLVAGFFRQQEAGWVERLAVVLGIVAFGAPLLIELALARPHPALDRTRRTAVVVGSTRALDHTDDLDEPYELIKVHLDIDGTTWTSHIADIIAAESRPRFRDGSSWAVYAFAGAQTKDPDPWFSRVILTEDHDDVMRTGYSLTRVTEQHAPASGSDLLLQRFAEPDSR